MIMLSQSILREKQSVNILHKDQFDGWRFMCYNFGVYSQCEYSGSEISIQTSEVLATDSGTSRQKRLIGSRTRA
jgi:hypothetical protein